jgi:alpha 1,3-glucosidase
MILLVIFRIKVEKKSDQVLVGYNEYQLVIQAKPFRLDIIEGNTLILSVNSKGLMKFEHSRDKE